MSKFRERRRRGPIGALALGALIAVTVAGIAIAGGNKEKACISNVCMEGGGGFAPKKLSKTKPTPITLEVKGNVKTTDGTHPPALKTVIFETDKNGAINVKHYPVCPKRNIESRDTNAAIKACPNSIIGKGNATAVISFPEQPDIPAKSKVIVFNGGIKGGTTTLYIHAYITVPAPAAIVTTVKITKIHNGRYGTKAVATIPKIASGAGSVSSFRLKIGKRFTYKGKKYSVLTAKCPDGRLQAHAQYKFDNGLTGSTEFVRPCTGVK